MSDMTPETDAAAGLLRQLSGEMADVVASAATWTVSVHARRRLPATGVVWSVDDTDHSSTIVTASHVVERDDDIGIITTDGTELAATLVGRDPEHDIAVLRVTQSLPVAPRSESPAIGGIAFAVGAAMGISATLGVISSISSRRGRRRRNATAYIGSDAPMFPGFSGGPLIDASGSMVGLLSSHLGRGQTVAIPVTEVERIVTAISTHGRIRRGYIGISAQRVELPAEMTASQAGLLLIDIAQDSPAANAGLIVGDIVLRIGEQATGNPADVRSALHSDTVGTTIPLHILRGGQPQTIDVTVAEWTGDQTG